MRRLISATLLALACAAGAQEPSPEEKLVSAAIRASLLNDREAVRDLARERQSAESIVVEGGGEAEPLAENVAALAAVTGWPMPLLEEYDAEMAPFRRDRAVRNLSRLMRRATPEQRFLEARRDRQYERLRRAYNAFASPLASAAQARFYPLLSLPFEFLDYLLVGRRFPTPERRKEYIAARSVARSPFEDIAAQATGVRDGWEAKRRDLAALQARQNGERAAAERRWLSADFWFRREIDLKGWTAPRRAAHQRVFSELARRRANEDRSMPVVDGDAFFGGTEEFALYSRLLRAFVLNPADDQVEKLIEAFRVDYPMSEALDSVDAAGLAREVRRKDWAMARVLAADLAAVGDLTGWSDRARRLLDADARFAPERLLAAGESAAGARFRAYLFEGEDPRVIERAFSAEEARLRRRSLADRARALFVTDVISRAMILPFLDPFPRPELADAAKQVPREWLASRSADAWLPAIARAQEIEKRFRDAAETWRLYGDDAEAEAMDKKAARRLEKLADESGDARLAALLLRRLLNAYPEYAHRERAERSLAERQAEADAAAIIPRDELDSYEELWFQQGLNMPDTLIDGEKANGEISAKGIYILRYPAYSYVDDSTGARVEIPLGEAEWRAIQRELEPRRRLQALDKELAKPLPRRRIPLALEAGVFPGFEVMPGLVPLSPDERERKLYE